MKVVITVILIFLISISQGQKYMDDYNESQRNNIENVNKDFLQKDDYVALIRGGLCSIPTFGAAIDCVFGILWNKFNPADDPLANFVTKEEFDKRMGRMMNDMKEYTQLELTKNMISNAKEKFNNIYNASKFYDIEMDVFVEEMKANGTSSEDFKRSFPAIYFPFIRQLEEGILHFSESSRIQHLGKLWMETSFILLAVLRDTKFLGKKWGLQNFIIEGHKNKYQSVDERIHTLCKLSLGRYHEFMYKLSFVKHKQLINFGEGIQGKVDAIKIPNYSPLISQGFYYSDITLHKTNQTWLNPKVHGFQQISYNIPTSNRIIYLMDFSAFGVDFQRGHLLRNKQMDPLRQSCDFVTGAIGVYFNTQKQYFMDDFHIGDLNKPNLNPTTFYSNIYLSDSKNMFFRISIRVEQSEETMFDFIIYELDESKLPNDVKTNKKGLHLADIKKYSKKTYTEKFDKKTITYVFKPTIQPSADLRKVFPPSVFHVRETRYAFMSRGFFNSKTYSFNSKVIAVAIVPTGDRTSCHLTNFEIHYA